MRARVRSQEVGTEDGRVSSLVAARVRDLFSSRSGFRGGLGSLVLGYAGEAGVACFDDCFGSVEHLQFLLKMFDTWLRTVFGLSTSRRAIAGLLSDLLEHFSIARGEPGECLGGRCGEVVDQSSGYGWAEDRFAVGNGADGADGLLVVCAFEEVAAGAAVDRRVQVRPAVVGTHTLVMSRSPRADRDARHGRSPRRRWRRG